MQSTKGFRLHATDHALNQILQKGFAVEKIRETFENPVKLYKNGKYEGQFRVTGNGLCLVGKPKGNTFTLITVYEDGVLTPPRPDQLETPEGQAYARKYAEGKARDNEYMPRVLARKAA
jgi:hypothetical protein